SQQSVKERLIENEVAPTNGLAPEAIESVRSALSRILASKLFLGSERLRRFLQFIVEQTLLGRTAGIKEYALAVEVFDKETSFDPRVDPVVRVEAGRLRAKLREYYEVEGQSDPVRIDLPKGTYAPVFRFIRPVEAPPPKDAIIPRLVA